MWRAAVALLLLSAAAAAAEPPLTADYYAQTCPQAADIITGAFIAKQTSSPTTAAGTLRLFFHDCFLDGCDASVLISSNAFNRAERDADINLSLPGDSFDAITRAKTALELACPATVSCADLLAMATRDLLSMLGGPLLTLKLGRKDSLVSSAEAVDRRLPRSNATVSELITLFAARGFSPRELVALSGAHTVGFAHCSEFAARFDGGVRAGEFARVVRRACAGYEKRPTLAVFNDVVTPSKFDNMYYRNLMRGMGLLATDQALAEDRRTRRYVRRYAGNQTAFFVDFARAVEKLSVYGVKTGRHGEVRRRCDQFNSLPL
ncbi:peroxidase 41-like [Wolffia australiana]